MTATFEPTYEASFVDRFVGKIRVFDEAGCWRWSGRLTSTGYGQIWCALGINKSLAAHRVSYELFVAPIPPELEIDHLCGVRDCVNPAHLEPVTHKENMARGKVAQKTHCKHGHELSGDNLRLRVEGGRRCKECHRRITLASYHRRMKAKS